MNRTWFEVCAVLGGSAFVGTWSAAVGISLPWACAVCLLYSCVAMWMVDRSRVVAPTNPWKFLDDPEWGADDVDTSRVLLREAALLYSAAFGRGSMCHAAYLESVDSDAVAHWLACRELSRELARENGIKPSLLADSAKGVKE